MRSPFRRWSIVVAAASAVAAGAAFFPATWMLRLGFGPGEPLRFEDVSGWWWNGRAQAVSWRDLNLGTVAWELTEVSLRAGLPEMQVAIAGAAPDYALTAKLGTAGRGIRNVRELRGHIPAGWLIPPEVGLLLRARGRVDLDVARLEVNAIGVPIRADGVATWEDAGLAGTVRADLGTLQMILESTNETTTMELNSLRPGEVRIHGQGRYGAGGWTGTVRLAPTGPGTALTELLSDYGETQPDGSVLLSFAGRLETGEP